MAARRARFPAAIACNAVCEPGESTSCPLRRGSGSQRHTRRATLAVARKMVALMLAVERRNTDFVPAAAFRRTAGGGTPWA
jgi:hypothetical protein